MAELGAKGGGLGRDIGHGTYEKAPDRSNPLIGALEINVLATVATLAVACAPRVPKVIRATATAAGAFLGANAYLIFQDEINRPTGK